MIENIISFQRYVVSSICVEIILTRINSNINNIFNWNTINILISRNLSTHKIMNARFIPQQQLLK